MKAFHEVRSYDSNFMMWHSAYQNISFLAHWHNELELIYAREGVSSITVNDDTYQLEAGGLVVCNSGDIHYSDSADPQNALDFLVFDPGILDPQYREVAAARRYIPAAMLDELGLSGRLSELFNQLPQELRERQPYYQEIAASCLRGFWYLLKRRLPPCAQEPNRRNSLIKRFHELLRYLDEHYAEPLTLESAAARIGYTPSHFSKTFKKLTGINFVTYLSMIRVEQACALLKKSGKRTVDIAQICGFNNLRTFNRSFKEITGYTPTEFKNLSDAGSYTLTYYKRRSTEQTLAEWDSPTVIMGPRSSN